MGARVWRVDGDEVDGDEVDGDEGKKVWYIEH